MGQDQDRRRHAARPHRRRLVLARSCQAHSPRRGTFARHLAGPATPAKTTLTEKLLLYGGAINTAGQVAARRRARSATSDWMELERERGISITSTVLQFPYHGHTINLLDTPGHQDFGEDTYRTLLAADSAVMLIDAAKGVEPQTRKLFAICRARRIPLFTFINKMDRPSRDPLELLDELENVLGIGAYPMNWPLGSGPTFRGVYDRETHDVHLFERTEHGAKRAPVSVADVRDPRIAALTDEGPTANSSTARSARRCGRGFRPRGDAARRRDAGVLRQRDDELRRRAVPRRVRRDGAAAGARSMRPPAESIEPTDELLGLRVQDSGQHGSAPPRSGRVRARLLGQIRTRHDGAQRAPARTCADARDEIVRQRARVGRFRVRRRRAWASQIRARSRSATRSPTPDVRFDAIPAFEPEHFALVRSTDTGAYKSFQKGIAQLREEGAIQVLYPYGQTRTEPILAAVGELQFEVVKYRLESEYNVKTVFTSLPFSLARRVGGDADAIAAATTAVERADRRGLGRRAAGALRERVESAFGPGMESGADVRAVHRTRARNGTPA
jgi:peptide chain release factor 3